MKPKHDSLEEQLLGYVLDALDPQEHADIEARLRAEPALREQLARIAATVTPLGDPEHFDAPPHLTRRTCEFVALQAHVLSTNSVRSEAERWQLQDLVVAAGIFIAAAMLFFPAVNHSRFTARLAMCQNNLRAIGQALVQYSQLQGGAFPYVAPSGPLSVAGVYGPALVESGALADPRHLVCPESELAVEGNFTLPTTSQLEHAHGAALKALQARAGGSYGYTLGHVEGGEYHGTKNQSRAQFALVADAPQRAEAGWASTNHGPCNGQNVLFEDGHASFLKRCCDAFTGQDDIFVNEHGLVAAGTHSDDSVISPSGVGPRLNEMHSH
jgi:hypothetical protein